MIYVVSVARNHLVEVLHFSAEDVLWLLVLIHYFHHSNMSYFVLTLLTTRSKHSEIVQGPF